MKYQLTKTSKTLPDGTIIRQIKWMEDIPAHGIKKGDLGGWLKSRENYPTSSLGVVRGGVVSGIAVVSGGVVSGGEIGGGWVCGGEVSGGEVSGGEVSGGWVRGGVVSGGVVRGGVVSGIAVVSGGEVSGGEVSGGVVSGGLVRGGVVSGGVVSGGVVSGTAVVSGGEVSGGVVSGGVVSGGEVSSGWVSGNNDLLLITPIGRDNGALLAVRTADGGIICTRGCFAGTIEELDAASLSAHVGEYACHRPVYVAAIALIKAKFGGEHE